MADRYWVGASGAQWNTTNTAVWSATSGGPSGASVPTAADSVFFDQAGTFNIVLTGALTCLDFNVTAGALTFSSTGTLVISGNMAISNVTPVWTASSVLTFNATTAKTIQSNGVLFAAPITFNGAGGTWTLSGNLTTAGIVTLLQGSIDLDGNILSGFRFASSGVNTRAIAFGSGKFVLSGAATVWNTVTSTNLTVTGTPVVDLTYALADAVTVNAGSLTETSSISFNVTAGTYALTLTGNSKNVDFTGFAGSLVNSLRTIFGNLVLSSGMTVSAGGTPTTFAATSGIKTITTNGKLVDFPVTFSGVGGTWQLQDALTLGSTRTLTLSNGTFDLNGKTLTTGTFSSTNSNIRVLTMTGASVVVLGSVGTAWTMGTSTNATVNASGSTVSMNSASAKIFSGGGLTYGTLVQGGAGALTVVGSNRFADISNAVQPATVRLSAGTTQTVSAFSLSGTSGNLITLDTNAAGTRATLSDASGIVSVSFVSIKDINATGGATWDALTANGNVDAGNNLGWNFGAVPVIVKTIFRQVFRPVFSEIFRPIF